jgi:hypothetical protein
MTDLNTGFPALESGQCCLESQRLAPAATLAEAAAGSDSRGCRLAPAALRQDHSFGPASSSHSELFQRVLLTRLSSSNWTWYSHVTVPPALRKFSR